MGSRMGFLGAGKMGSALIKGILGSGKSEKGNIYAFDIDSKKVEELAKKYGVIACKSNTELIEKCDNVVLAVKPAVVADALKGCAKLPGPDKTIISIAAGISIGYIRKLVGDDCSIVRAMPNTPALIGEGMTAIAFEKGISDVKKQEIIDLFQSVGKVEVMDESLMNDVIALTSSSPAYVYMFIEAMADASVRAGIARDMAYRLAAQSVLGAAKMVLETGTHPGILKDDVCSPAGTTIEAVYTLEKRGFRHSIMEAMHNCSMKAKGLEVK